MIMSEFWKTKKFSEISKEWAQKLAQSDFNDIEREIKGERVLKDYASNVYRSYDSVYVEQRRKYFRKISHHAERDRAMPPRDRMIMRLYSDGVKQSLILEELQKGGHQCTNRITITRTISRYLHKWNIPLLKPRKTK